MIEIRIVFQWFKMIIKATIVAIEPRFNKTSMLIYMMVPQHKI